VSELASHRRLHLMSMLQLRIVESGVRVRRNWGGRRKGGRKKRRLKIPRRKAYAESRKRNLLAAKHFAREPRL